MTVPMSFAGGMGLPGFPAALEHSVRERQKSLPHEMRAGEIIAWRAWTVIGDEELGSMAAAYIWPTDRPAEGDVSSIFGVHAFKTRQDAVEQYKYYPRSIIGRVALFGTVVEHRDGYRAQYARVYELERFGAQLADLDPFGFSLIFEFFERRRNKKRLARLREKYLAWRSNSDARVLMDGAHGTTGIVQS